MQILGRSSRVVIASVLLSLVPTAGIFTSSQSASASNIANVQASYDGGTINLSDGWGSATVCDVTNLGTHCFATFGEYQTWLSTQNNSEAASSSCSSSLDLFQDESYGGDELILSATLIWINLSDYSFADETSSYKVGACAIDMTDAQNGSGDVYPGATSAGSEVSWIGTAWNDRVQSVYIN